MKAYAEGTELARFGHRGTTYRLVADERGAIQNQVMDSEGGFAQISMDDFMAKLGRDDGLFYILAVRDAVVRGNDTGDQEKHFMNALSTQHAIDHGFTVVLPN